MSSSPPYPILKSTEFPEGSMSGSTTAVPTFQPSASQSTLHAVDSQGLFEKEQNLMRWEEELRHRERNLNLNGQASSDAAGSASTAAAPGQVNMMTNNPMGPANYPSFMPITRVAVSEDIPVPNQRLVKFSYVVFFWTCASLIWNFVCGIPFTFFMTRRLYRAARSQKPKATYSFLLGYFALLCFNIMFFIGFKHSGMHGLIWLISLFHNKHKAVGALHVVALFFWFVNFFLVAGIFFKVLRLTSAKKHRGEMDYGMKSYIKSR
ncbi:spore coat protein [Heterostelium album PN500]|uniref:Spore coat protein n=1 Tax=Heterostelium pallidum (strain ATCC 26659 / Pp 5 / PN500) TaxID=670386 RepID=D3BUA8_HETP5|nr:spore coat protein [Heterostelium album PN500]EFA75042.1 spore coat protein [Heterostelium album PN500]|eukprot:XP_020427176.1 spore coat protein [Heterostelium album PN500]